MMDLCRKLKLKIAPQLLLLLAAAASTLACSLANADTLYTGLMGVNYPRYAGTFAAPEANFRLLKSNGELYSLRAFQHTKHVNSGPSYAVGYGRGLALNECITVGALGSLVLRRATSVANDAFYQLDLQPSVLLQLSEPKIKGKFTGSVGLEAAPRSNTITVGFKLEI